MIKERLPPAVLQEVIIIIINKYVQDRLTWAEPRYELVSEETVGLHWQAS